MSRGSVTRWLREVGNGDDAAAGELWKHFFERIVQLANRRLGRTPRQVRDEEDIALSAFKSLWRGLQQGRFPDLHSRDDLWKLLIVITSRKVQDQISHDHRQKRSPDGPIASLSEDEIARQVTSREPSPEFASMMADTIDALIDRLGQPELRTIALMKLEGYTNEEIAGRTGRGLATVERKLRTIRAVWEESE